MSTREQSAKSDLSAPHTQARQAGEAKESLLSFHTVKWFQIERNQLEVRLSTDFTNGLTEKRVKELQKRYGKNILAKNKRLSFIGKFLRQFKSPLVIILLIAGIATLFLEEYLDSTVIFIALFINVFIGLFQEERASMAFEKLNKSQKKYATVVRDGRKKMTLIEDVVIGDIVILEAGMNVPADIRLLEETDLTVNEAPLTGEWISVDKEAGVISNSAPMSEQYNMLWMGTLISNGFGKGVVVETGASTQLGSIAQELVKKDTVRTPIQKSIHSLAVFLSYVIIGAVLLIFGLGLLRDEVFFDMLLISIAIAVSVVPEGLPAAVTAVLAIGMEKILRSGGLVRNLLAAETLGSTTIIITDKTGTLTQAKMKLKDVLSLDILLGDFEDEDKRKYSTDLLKMAVLSSDAFVEENKTEESGVIVRGRPIEKAIVTAGLEMGLSQEALSTEYKRIDFLAFSSANRFAVSLNKEPKSEYNRIYFSGSPEYILEISSYTTYKSQKIRMTDKEREIFIRAQDERSSDGMRLIAVGFKDIKDNKITREKERNKISKDLANDIVFAGILSFSDPIRPDVKEAIKTARSSGVKVIMATGDNAGTAKEIAKESGIAGTRTIPVLGSDIDNVSNKDLVKIISKSKVFARILPIQKLRMVRALRNSGEVVAMTGDGINDAPALRSADIGIAVGSGTDVAKEASDLVLLDNSFSIIISAIREGRRIIDNLKRIISHLVSTSFGEIFLISGALLFAVPLPILPAQILWVNIVEGGLLNFAFAFEPAEKDIMKRDPNLSSSTHLMSPDIKKLIFTIGTITGLFTLALYMFLRQFDIPLEELRTIMFVTLSFDSIFFILSLKSFVKPVWKIKIFSNVFLILSVTVSVLTLLAALFFVPLRNLLQLTTLDVKDILVLVVVALFNLATIEVAKYFIFWRPKNTQGILWLKTKNKPST